MMLFEGKNMNSLIIKVFTLSSITHVGMVWRCPFTDEAYIWEIGGQMENNTIKKKGSAENSARLTNLNEKVKNYRGAIWYRKLDRTNIDELDLAKRTASLFCEHMGTEYKYDTVSAWNNRARFSFIPLSFLERGLKQKQWMCSELIALSYHYLGIIDFEMFHELVLPFDFTVKIPCVEGYSFGDLTKIKENS